MGPCYASASHWNQDKGAQMMSLQFRAQRGRAEGMSGEAEGDFQDSRRGNGRVGHGGTSCRACGLEPLSLP